MKVTPTRPKFSLPKDARCRVQSINSRMWRGRGSHNLELFPSFSYLDLVQVGLFLPLVSWGWNRSCLFCTRDGFLDFRIGHWKILMVYGVLVGVGVGVGFDVFGIVFLLGGWILFSFLTFPSCRYHDFFFFTKRYEKLSYL
jgi:hypothetical protein